MNRSKGVWINFHQSEHLDVNSPEVLIYPWAERKRLRNYDLRNIDNETLAQIDEYPLLGSGILEIGYWSSQNLIRKELHTKEDIEYVIKRRRR